MTTEMFNVSPAATQSGSRIRKTVTRGLLVAAMTGGLAFGMAMPAFADGPTATTFTITGGTLAVAVAPNATLTTAVYPITTITGTLGNVVVTDGRGALLGWAVTAVSSTFVSTPTDEASTSTIVNYAAGTITPSGTVTTTPTTGDIMTEPAVVVAGTAVHGANGATFNPTVTVTLPDGAVAGTYAGTVTTSVA